ncbi:MAG TPA: methyltransferase [Bacteroidia bacterium]|jgi:hypothetical protein|nr:methyltransferase [Bacteroidia bacterium]
MERLKRKPLQGVINIIRFNWHYYAATIVLTSLCFLCRKFLPFPLNTISLSIAYIIIIVTTISLAVSFYVYDITDLYSLNWLNPLHITSNKQLVNIHAGFDETSAILKDKYPGSKLTILDFYDPSKHTEISIERARKAYPAFPGTQTINTSEITLAVNSVDYFFLILAAHEIRNYQERASFFKQLKNILSTDGKIIVVEHQRDIHNLLAYNIGFLHFLSNQTWRRAFENAGLTIESETKINPFITMFILI